MRAVAFLSGVTALGFVVSLLALWLALLSSELFALSGPATLMLSGVAWLYHKRWRTRHAAARTSADDA